MIKRNLKKIYEDTIAHYNRMIEWASKQKGKVSLSDMVEEIKEGWQSDFCPYCKNFWIAHRCEACPLDSEEPPFCCNDLWYYMNKSNTWKQWVRAAKKVLKYIEKYGMEIKE